MLDSKKPMTHTAWAQHYQGGQFRKWVETGEGRAEIDANGIVTVHVYEDRIPRGDSGYICLMPIGVKPPEPQPPQPRRPPPPGEDEDSG